MSLIHASTSSLVGDEHHDQGAGLRLDVLDDEDQGRLVGALDLGDGDHHAAAASAAPWSTTRR
jgi:hypothetical protein